jgi:hypothetical protein
VWLVPFPSNPAADVGFINRPRYIFRFVLVKVYIAYTCSQIVVASATDCKVDFIVSNQVDADAQLAGCDTAIESIVIGSE